MWKISNTFYRKCTQNNGLSKVGSLNSFISSHQKRRTAIPQKSWKATKKVVRLDVSNLTTFVIESNDFFCTGEEPRHHHRRRSTETQ
ncbi:Uncharacterised protein [Porphyromonas cangingivalis]|uniref:Uncharacterized protein n=1 Tax=Porphyromonas cangingivalis TaxID=36874 RepID=A0A1T4L3G8_PORCN|nr:hypothetical protein SAMN02745205_01004 [Porphyromonas cangingivalis]VEJ03934.1 Uncharacterised protein [Porphyromonas cangingivalis]